MNPVSSLIFKWYFFLTFLAVFSSTTVDFISVFSGLILAWFVFTVFFIGANKTISLSNKALTSISTRSNLGDCKLYSLPIISFFSVISSFYAAYFYTGKTFLEVFSALALNVSLYNEYQKYFASQGLGTFSLLKIPAILSMLYLKVSVVYSFLSVFVLTRKVKVIHIFWILIIAFSSLYFSLSRGTSFEFFELLLLLWFCLSMRTIRYNHRNSVFSRKNIVMAVIGFAALTLYSYNISARYSFRDVSTCITLEMCLDDETLLYFVSSPIAELTLKLSGYFTFGIYYTSVFLNDFWLNGFKQFMMLFFPFASFYDDTVSIKMLCDVTIDCGAAWIPDIVIYIINAGFILIFLASYLVGRFIRGITFVAFSESDVIIYAILYLAFLSLVSLPVGNFLTISSANVLLLVLVSIVYFFRKVMKNS